MEDGGWGWARTAPANMPERTRQDTVIRRFDVMQLAVITMSLPAPCGFQELPNPVIRQQRVEID